MVDKGEQPAQRRPCGFEPGKPCRDCSEAGVEMHGDFDSWLLENRISQCRAGSQEMSREMQCEACLRITYR